MDFANANSLEEVTKGGKQAGRANTFSVDGEGSKKKRARTSQQTDEEVGKRECFNFKKTGDCKYGRLCKYRHGDKNGTGRTSVMPKDAPSNSVNSVVVQKPSTDSENLKLIMGYIKDQKSSDKAATEKATVHTVDSDSPGGKSTYPAYDKYEHSVFSLQTNQDCPEEAPADLQFEPRTWKVWVQAILVIVALGAWLLDSWSENQELPPAPVTIPSALLGSMMTGTSRSVVFFSAILLFVLTGLASAAQTPLGHEPVINAECFSVGGSSSASCAKGYEWCSDSGTNRFVTNDVSDFVPSTIVDIDTTVAVGGGTVVSHQSGTVMVKSLDFDHIIHCKDVLYMPTCGKKLMPAHQFIKKRSLSHTRTTQST